MSCYTTPSPSLQQLDGAAHHVVAHVDIALGGGQVPMTGQRHDDLGADTGMGELGDEPAATAMRGRSIEASVLVELRHKLTQRIGQERSISLRRRSLTNTTRAWPPLVIAAASLICSRTLPSLSITSLTVRAAISPTRKPAR